MSNRKLSQLTTTSAPITGDFFTMLRTSEGATDDGNLIISKADFDTYVQSLLIGAYTTVSIATGVTKAINLGLIASYHGFKIEFIAGNASGKRFSGNTDVVYNDSDTLVYPANGGGNYDLMNITNGINIENAVDSGGNFIWLIKNNSVVTITFAYRITELKPAL